MASTLAEIPLNDDDEAPPPPRGSSTTGTPAATSSTGPVESIKIVLVGDPSVGKTEFANCFKTRTFSGNTVATIGMGHTSVDMRLCAEGVHVRVELYDTAGQERYGNQLMRTYYRLAHGVIIVFDPGAADSLVRAQKLYQQITEDMPDIVCMFIANKIDLITASEQEWELRLRKLANLFTPPPTDLVRRPPSQSYLPAELEMPLKAISLKRNPAVALDLVAELSQRILINRTTAAIRASTNPLTPHNGAALGSSRVIARQQRSALEQQRPGKSPPLRLQKQDASTTKEPERKKLGSGSCFF